MQQTTLTTPDSIKQQQLKSLLLHARINLESAVECEFRLQGINSAMLLKNLSFPHSLSMIF